MAAALHPNALQARVHKLLNSRAEIESTKALLSTLVASEPAPSHSTVQQQSHANAYAPLTAIVTMDASSSLADLRKNLRLSLEEKQLALAESVLQGLSQTLAKVSLLRENVESLDAKCAHIQTFLETTKRETQQVQAEAALLADKKEKMQHELDEIRTFLGRYQLSEQETQGLYAKNLDDEHMHAFLDIMERVQQVKLDCKVLVASGDVNCGLELLDSVGKYQEVGFERLYQWTSKKCSEMEGEPSNQLHRAIALLRDRVEFYNYCKECITSSRRSVLVRRFIIALTRGGPNGIPRPIEMHAHDPVRYCGDMLAWVHQAIATENEFFRVLFDGDLKFEPEAKGTSIVEGQEASSSETVNEVATAPTTSVSMVGKAFEGVARPLQVRIEQTLSSQLGIVIVYKLVLLLAFYDHKFGTLVAHSAIARALEHCREASNRAFKQQFQMLVDAVASSAQDYSTNLSATHATMDASHRLVSLLEVFQTSLLPEDEKEGDLKPLFDGILPAMALMCERSVYGLDPVDALVFKVNNLSCIQVPLVRFPEATKWHTRIGNDIAQWLKDISELEMKSVLDRCNVALLLHSIHQFQTSEAAASAASGLAIQAKGLEGETVATVMNGFCSALMTLVFPQIDQIAQPDLREKARFLTATQLAATYAFVYDFVYDIKHGYRSQGVVLMHTPQEGAQVSSSPHVKTTPIKAAKSRLPASFLKRTRAKDQRKDSAIAASANFPRMQLLKLVRSLLVAVAHASLAARAADDSINGELMPTSSSNIVGDTSVVVVVASRQGISLPQTRESTSGVVADTNLARVSALKHGPEVAGEGDNVAAEEDQVQSSDVVADSSVVRIMNLKQRAEVVGEAAEMRSPDIVADTNLARAVDPKQGDKVAVEGDWVQNSGIVADTNLAKTVDAKQGFEVAAEAADQVESAVVEADTHLEVFMASGVSGDNGTTDASEVDNTNQVLYSTVTIGTSNVRHVQFAIREGREKSRGVNLGGWLVAEHWMTKDSEIWWGISNEDADCGEYTAMTKTIRELATQRAKAHRDRFITEADVQKIASVELNTVRVPVGFWIVGFDDHDPSNQKQWQMYAPHGLDYLDKLIRDWAKKHNVAVLISMHAAKGSQNGADHSSPQVKGQSYWAAYPENIASTLDAVRFLASRYKNDDAFLGIGLLNEPGGSTSTTQLYKYYEDAYRLIRVEDQNDCVLAISPLLWEQSPDHMIELLPYAKNVWVEWHRYFVWGYGDTSEDDLLTKSIPAFRDDVERWKTKSDKKVFIGEFSFATSKAQFNDFNNKSRVREFAQAQMDVLEQSVDGGWTFWTWRIDGDDKPNELSRWSLRNMIENEIFPSLSKGYV